MATTLFKRKRLLIPFVWITLGLAYGLQHYFSYLSDGYSCNFVGTTLGQMPNFLIWGLIATLSFDIENDALKLNAKFNRDLKFLQTVAIVFGLHLIVLFTSNWLFYGGSFQSAIIDYQQRYMFGWLYFQILVYSVIISFYAPSLWNRLINRIQDYRSKKYLVYFDLDDNNSEKRIYLENIESINANDYYIELRLPDRKYLIRDSLKEVEKKIDPNKFMRIHRSTIVNVKMVTNIFFSKDHWFVETTSGCTYPVGRSRKNNVLLVFKK